MDDSKAYTILRNDEDSEECVNDTYLRTWNSIPPNRPNRLRTFLGKITRNLSLNKWEKLSAEKRGAGQISLVLDEFTECIPHSKSAENIIDDVMIRDTINRFLDQLPSEIRKIFVRRYWYMSPVREIAHEYGLSESKVTVTLFRTREKLKTILEKEGIALRKIQIF
jgi:RNA polymerase sigma factor (sigma-70 family)